MMFDMEVDARAEPRFGSTGGAHTPDIQTRGSLCNSPAQLPSRHLVERFGLVLACSS